MKLHLVSRYAFLLIMSVLFVFPLYWMLTGSFKTQVAIWAIPPQWFPSQFRSLNYEHIFTTTPALKWLFNSVFTSLATVVFVVIFSAMAGYAYAKKRFPGDKILFMVVIATMMMPTQVTLVPLYIVCRRLGLVNSYLGVILPAIAFPFGVFIVRQFAKSIPDELIESARIDGAGKSACSGRLYCPCCCLHWARCPSLLSCTPGTITYGAHYFAIQGEADAAARHIHDHVFREQHELRLCDGGSVGCGRSDDYLFPALLQRSFIKGITLGSVKG
ncbi:carbohydrate ABC transporter permease [Paenibacillus sp. P25]|nr:carbohydrate ABC transporter permease [Paenibacillus sp. P25]